MHGGQALPLGVLSLALSLVRVNSAGDDCPLLAPKSFSVRAVRKQEGEWTADIFFRQWPSAYTILLHWDEPTTLLTANHAQIVGFSGTNSLFTTITADERGPDDGTARLMLHMKGLHPTTPAIECYSNQPEEGDSSKASKGGSISNDKESEATNDFGTTSEPSLPVHGGSDESSAHSYDSDISQSDRTSDHVDPDDTASEGENLADETRDGNNSQNCATEDSAQLELVWSLGMESVVHEADCSAIDLEMSSALRLCHADDKLSLQWLHPDVSQWQTLEESVSPSQPRIHIDGLDAASVYYFRLSLLLSGAASEIVGPATPPLLVDGSSLLHLATEAHLQPVPTSSSSIEIPWLSSVCRPGLKFKVQATRVAEEDGIDDADTEGESAHVVADEEVELGAGSLIVQRLRCPHGCRLQVEPIGLQGWTLPATSTRKVTTPRLPPFPRSACRLEARMRYSMQQDIMTENEEALGSFLASDLADALGVSSQQVRLVEQRLDGRYIIFDLLSRSADEQAAQLLCDLFGDAVFWPSSAQRPSSCTELPQQQSEVCKAAAGLSAGKISSHIDPAGDVIQLLTDGNERSLREWLRDSNRSRQERSTSRPPPSSVPPDRAPLSGIATKSPGKHTSLPPVERAETVRVPVIGVVLVIFLIAIGAYFMCRKRPDYGGFKPVASVEGAFGSEEDETAMHPPHFLRQRFDGILQTLGIRTREHSDELECGRVDTDNEGRQFMLVNSKGWVMGPPGERPLRTQQVSFETVEGACFKSECYIYPSDNVSTIEARLRVIGEKVLPSMRITALSIQYYFPELKRMVEVEHSTTLDELLHAKASEWRVLIIGVPSLIANRAKDTDKASGNSELTAYASRQLLGVQSF